MYHAVPEVEIFQSCVKVLRSDRRIALTDILEEVPEIWIDNIEISCTVQVIVASEDLVSSDDILCDFSKLLVPQPKASVAVTEVFEKSVEVYALVLGDVLDGGT